MPLWSACGLPPLSTRVACRPCATRNEGAARPSLPKRSLLRQALVPTTAASCLTQSGGKPHALQRRRELSLSISYRLYRFVPSLVVMLLILTAATYAQAVAPLSHPQAPPSRGPGAWPVKGALYEVSLEYYPNHS